MPSLTFAEATHPSLAARREGLHPTRTPAAPVVPIVVLVLGGIFTAVSFGTSWIHLAYRLPRLHVAIDTSIGLISFTLAYLVHGRVRAFGRRRDEVLVAAFAVGGAVNLLAAVTHGVASSPPGRFAAWAPTIGNLVTASLLAFAAIVPAGRARRTQGVPVVALEIVGAFAIVTALLGALAAHLPWSPQLAFSPTDASKPVVVGPAALVLAQGLVLVAYSVAAWGFSHRESEHDDLTTWLASSCMLFGLASLDYLAFPSSFSDWIYAGDVLRLAAVSMLLVGAAREVRRTWMHAAALETRRDIARDLHDGVAQELAFISSVAGRLANDVDHSDARTLADAATRALDESRLVISTLAGTGDVLTQLAATARDAANRYALDVVLDVPDALDVPADLVEPLLRITREATNNAGRHASATIVRVAVHAEDTFRVEIADDGRGFDPSRPRAGFGLVSMRERAEAAGGTFTVTSAPGRGTRIEVSFPCRSAS